jgi:nucleotide-binding universal stress UspA family protein
MKLLIGYDGSDCARTALGDLQHAGLPADVEATVVSVADVWPQLLLEQERGPDDPLSNPAFLRLTRRARTEANQAMADARQLADRCAERVRNAFPTWTVHADAIAGSPAWELLKRAEQLKVDLIVLGSHGRSAIGRTLLGSVSQRVLHHATCSVRVARGPYGLTAPSDRPVKLVLGVDGSVGAASAVSAVAMRNWPAKSEVLVVAAASFQVLLFMFAGAEAVAMPPTAISVREDETGYAHQMLNAVCEELRAAGLSAKSILREGDPKHVLPHEASECGADCIFVGAQGLSRMERLLIGSVSSSVAAHASCSVEVVRAGT